MKINESVRATVLQALRKKKETRTWLSESMGMHRSWATRFFDGSIKSLTDEQVIQLQELLSVEFFTLVKTGKQQHSALAQTIAGQIDSDEAFAEVVSALHEAMKGKIYTPRYIPTKDMAKLGKEIIGVCKTNEDKPGKVARLVLELLA